MSGKKGVTSINLHDHCKDIHNRTNHHSKLDGREKQQRQLQQQQPQRLEMMTGVRMTTASTPTTMVKVMGSNVNTNTNEESSSYEKCHYCDEILLPPIYQCYNGHIFCNVCEPKILTRRCPECEAPLSDNMKIRNRYMEKHIEQIIFKCVSPCKAQLSWNNVKDHWIHCTYRKHPICQYLDLPCAVESSSDNIIGHLKAVHKLAGVEVKNTFNQWTIVVPILQKVEKTHYQVKNISWTPHYFQFDNNLFFMRTLWESGTNSVTWVISQLILRREHEKEWLRPSDSVYLARIKLTKPNADSKADYMEWQQEIQSLSATSTFGEQQNYSRSFGIQMNRLEEKFCSRVTVPSGSLSNKTRRPMYKLELNWVVQVEIFPRARRASFRSFSHNPVLTTEYRLTDREPSGINFNQLMSDRRISENE